MTIVVARASPVDGPAAVLMVIGDPRTWRVGDARQFLYQLQHLVGYGITAQRIYEVRGGLKIEIHALGGSIATPPLMLSAEARTCLERLSFEVP